ncbi:MAG: L-lactate permease [Enterobacteriaceae bacterium]
MVAGGSFAIAQYLSSNFIEPELARRISSLVSLLCLTLFLKRWQPVRVFPSGDLGASRVDMSSSHRLHGRSGAARTDTVPVP